MNDDLTIDVLLSPLLQHSPACLCPSPEVRAQQIQSIAHSRATDVSEQAPPDPSLFCHGRVLGDSFHPACRNKQQQVCITAKSDISEHAS